ncbi:hypothetical protein AAF712_007966 [Marasmius tenuissimus]|uniref:Uncharacterized protein n=1 Tax=Marasmius tenuissimus TaxID=585030 RepID=A0ABR2ZTX2_9AGAR
MDCPESRTLTSDVLSTSIVAVEAMGCEGTISVVTIAVMLVTHDVIDVYNSRELPEAGTKECGMEIAALVSGTQIIDIHQVQCSDYSDYGGPPAIASRASLPARGWRDPGSYSPAV